MKWYLILYLFGGTGSVMVSKESFDTLEECGSYFNEVQNDLKEIKNVKEIRCEESPVVDSLKNKKFKTAIK